MKSILILAIILTISGVGAYPQTGYSTLPIDSTTKMVTYTEVITVDTPANKQELFSRAREWFAKAYNSSTNVIQMEDKESGKIIGKALMDVHIKHLGIRPIGYMNYTISIYVKDGRYKFEITDFYHTGSGDFSDFGTAEKMMNTTKGLIPGGVLSAKNTYSQILTQMDENIRDLIVSLKQSMNVKATHKKNEDW